MLANPLFWQPLGSPLASSFTNDDDRDLEASGDWVDKVMVNKDDNMSTRPGKEVSNGQKLSEKFYQRYIPDPTKIYPEHNLNKMTTNKKGNRDIDDDSDRESVTSDCSESDSVSSSIPKITISPNMLASKLKKAQPKKTTKSTEIR